MIRPALLAGLLTALPACASAQIAPSVISINLCTDQLVLALAEPGQIRGVSPFAQDAARASTHAPPVISATAEEVMLLKPDLVVAGRFDRLATQDFIRRQDLRLEAFDIARSIAEAREQITRMGALLEAPGKARRAVADIDAAVERLRLAVGRAPLRVLPYARRGWVEGEATLLADLLRAAGLASAATDAGLAAGGFLSLEDVIRLKPDALLISGDDAEGRDQGSALLLHPAIARLFPPERLIVLPGRLTVCGGPALVQAMDVLARRTSQIWPR